MLVYEVVNKHNGKVYVGLTTQDLPTRKSSHLRSAKSGSNMYFHKAIRKYGEDSFEWSVCAFCSDLESLYRTEKLYISLYEKDQMYNVSEGGEHSAYGLKHTEETKEICREHSLKRWDGNRASDKYPKEAFEVSSYKEAKAYGVPKTTWYREMKRRNEYH